MSRTSLYYIAWLVIIVAAVYLRFHDIGNRPMHFDEATGARIAARHLESGHYIYDPTHFHGPTLSFFTYNYSRISGEHSWKDLRAGSLRHITAIAGTLIVLVPILWIRWLGMGQALVSSTLLATSPLLVYYSRMYIHESLLGLFGLLTLTLSMLAWVEQKRIYWFSAGIAFGLMAATKATFAVSLMAWAASIALTLIVLKNHFNLTSISRQNWKSAFYWMLPAAILTIIYLYTDGLTNPEAIIDFIRTFFIYETIDGHNKPFWYYLLLLLEPKGNLRQFWWEGGIAVLALVSLIIAYGNRNTNRHPEQRFTIPLLALSIAMHFLIYGLIAYKTPWIILFPWIQVILLAGMLPKEMQLCQPGLRRGLTALILGVIALQSWQSFAVVRKATSDQRIPYAYVPTSSDIERLPAWLKDLQSIAPGNKLEPLGVLGTFYWPLPWYLRDFDEIGYWKKSDDALLPLAVVFVMPDQFESARDLLTPTHVSLPRGLRQENPMMMYVRKDIWNIWMKEGT